MPTSVKGEVPKDVFVVHSKNDEMHAALVDLLGTTLASFGRSLWQYSDWDWERRRLYGMLRLEVAPSPEGLEVGGALSTSGPRSTPESRSAKQSTLRFNAVLTNDSQEVCFDRSLGYG